MRNDRLPCPSPMTQIFSRLQRKETHVIIFWCTNRSVGSYFANLLLFSAVFPVILHSSSTVNSSVISQYRLEAFHTCVVSAWRFLLNRIYTFFCHLTCLCFSDRNDRLIIELQWLANALNRQVESILDKHGWLLLQEHRLLAVRVLLFSHKDKPSKAILPSDIRSSLLSPLAFIS